MAEIRKQSGEPRDFKERFEFVFTVDGKIIVCRRYFRINNFNPTSLRSYELTEAIRKCAYVIDRELKDKTQAYLEMYAPHSFDSVEEMNEWLSNPENAKRLSYGEGLVVRGNKTTDYVWTKKNVAMPLGEKFDDGEITENNIENNKVTYRFAFKVDEREVCAYEWDGYLPKFLRNNKIDITNKKGKFEGEDLDRLSFEQYLLYKMSEGKNDLSYNLIKGICYACSYADNDSYTTAPDAILDEWVEDSKKILWRVK